MTTELPSDFFEKWGRMLSASDSQTAALKDVAGTLTRLVELQNTLSGRFENMDRTMSSQAAAISKFEEALKMIPIDPETQADMIHVRKLRKSDERRKQIQQSMVTAVLITSVIAGGGWVVKAITMQANKDIVQQPAITSKEHP